MLGAACGSAGRNCVQSSELCRPAGLEMFSEAVLQRCRTSGAGAWKAKAIRTDRVAPSTRRFVAVVGGEECFAKGRRRG